MMRHQLGVRWPCFAILGLAVGLASCSKSADSGSAAASAAAAQSAGAAAASPAVSGAATAALPAAGPIAAPTAIASAQSSLDPNLRADLLEVKRVSGGALLVRWRLVNTTSAPSSGLVANATPKPILYNSWGWNDLYYTDPAENKKYSFLTDTDGGQLLDVYIGSYNAGEQRDNWAKFPAPPGTSSKVTIYIPKFPPFEDVPVS
jgi:hypothetical protein